MVNTGTEDTLQTWVLKNTHKKVKQFAAKRDIEFVDAYNELIDAGLRAFGYDPEVFLK